MRQRQVESQPGARTSPLLRTASGPYLDTVPGRAPRTQRATRAPAPCSVAAWTARTRSRWRWVAQRCAPCAPKTGPAAPMAMRPQRTTRGTTRSKQPPALYRVVWRRTAGVARPRVSTQRPRNTAPTSADVLGGRHGVLAPARLQARALCAAHPPRSLRWRGLYTRACFGRAGTRCVGGGRPFVEASPSAGAGPLSCVAHSAQLLTRACGRRHASRTTGTVQGGKTAETPRQETESHGLSRPRQPHLQRCARRRVRLQPGSPCPVTACHLFPQPQRATTRSRTRTARRPATRWRRRLLHTTTGSNSTAVAQTSRW